MDTVTSIGMYIEVIGVLNSILEKCTMLQAGKSRVRFLVSVDFAIDLILTGAGIA
jgi:hypothetical protein